MKWEMVRLGEVAEIVSGATPSRNNSEYWNGDIPWLTPKNIGNLNDPVVMDTTEKISREGLAKCSARLLPIGTVLFSSRAPIGHTAIAGIPLATNQGFKSLVPGRKVDSKYLYWTLISKKSEIIAKGRGATFKEVTKEIMEGVTIPLPPLNEQKRIAAILDKADAIRRKRQEAINLSDQFLRSVFLDMFGDPVTNPKGWEAGTIRDLVSEVKYGTSAKASSEGRYEILRMNNITYSGQLDLSDMKYIDLDGHDEAKYLARKGDLLFNRTNSKELVGKTAVYSFDEPRAIAGYLIRVRPNELANAEYIAAYLNSGHGKKILQHMCKSIVGMANINAQELQDIEILKPPVAVQNKFARIVDTVRRGRIEINSSLATMEVFLHLLSKTKLEA